MSRIRLRLAPLAALLVLAGCGAEASGPGTAVAPEAPVIVTTTTQVTDLTANVACDLKAGASCAIGPRGLLEGATDPHDYELRPDDVEALAEADVIIRSGGDVDAWLDEAIEASGSEAPVIDVLAAVGGEDPHWWTDPVAARTAVDAIRDGLAKASPGYADLFARNATTYGRRLADLETAIAECLGAIPRERRKAVTTHDALGRFATRYGIDIVGTVIPSRSTQGQASSGQVARLVAAIRAAGATAVFSEAFVSRRLERAISEEAGARLGKPLYLDSLAEESYLSATAKNARAMAEAFSDGKTACSLPS